MVTERVLRRSCVCVCASGFGCVDVACLCRCSLPSDRDGVHYSSTGGRWPSAAQCRPYVHGKFCLAHVLYRHSLMGHSRLLGVSCCVVSRCALLCFVVLCFAVLRIALQCFADVVMRCAVL